jgi:hypothetical protein
MQHQHEDGEMAGEHATEDGSPPHGVTPRRCTRPARDARAQGSIEADV